jgi:hypothetical protein
MIPTFDTSLGGFEAAARIVTAQEVKAMHHVFT